MRQLLPLYIYALLIITVLGCTKEQVPMYVRINKVNCITNFNTQGTDSQKITCISVFNGDNNSANLGTYSLPAHIPWLNTGESLWQVYGGVNENGINATKNFYPFWLPDSIYISYKQGDSFSYTPRMRYRSGTVFSVIDNFESGTWFKPYECNTILTRTEDISGGEVFQGGYSGKIKLDSATSFCTIITPPYTMPLDGQAVFVELNYKCSVPFTVGIQYIDKNTQDTTSDYPVTVNPKTTWNKIYINISVDVQSAQAPWYKLLISTATPTGATSGYVLLDNVKLLHL